jgi:hypothetical protein
MLRELCVSDSTPYIYGRTLGVLPSACGLSAAPKSSRRSTLFWGSVDSPMAAILARMVERMVQLRSFPNYSEEL